MNKLANFQAVSVNLPPAGQDQGEKFAHSMVKRIHVWSAVEAAAQSIRDAILTRKLRPGMRLVERSLANALGIGQPTLREALKELEYQGFVRRTPQKGTHVAMVTRDDAQKIQEVRMLLEAFAVERAAVNITPDAELKLRDLLRQMSAAADSFDLAAFHDADVEFHRQVWALAGNEYLSASLEGIAFRLFVLGCLNHGRDQLLASVEQHKGILEGLCSREPKKARVDFISHTLHFWDEADKVTPSPPAVYRSSGTGI